MILTIRTDKPESEIGLYENGKQLTYETWQAHRQLAETVHIKINELLKSKSLSLQELKAIVCYQGPGSFTGLRIGISVANALAYGLHIPIIGIERENNWQEKGLTRIKNKENDQAVMPAYGAPVHITPPRK
ncbi:MAG: tRNA (adenosine(37)-N6)-threonylcarbamoyltransferase complex dimerization subunit type 1 TsaB [bacterium]|nr:tRNA (adenosine(37)-N6)-threonylcarbamoyltransferase complex dimerization subunit type 1 TsaB [bacterium]